MGNARGEPCRLLSNWSSLRRMQQKWNGEQQLGPVLDSRPLRRFYDFLYLLKRSTGDAAGRQCLGICRVCGNQCDCWYCSGGVGVFLGALK